MANKPQNITKKDLEGMSLPELMKVLKKIMKPTLYHALAEKVDAAASEQEKKAVVASSDDVAKAFALADEEIAAKDAQIEQALAMAAQEVEEWKALAGAYEQDKETAVTNLQETRAKIDDAAAALNNVKTIISVLKARNQSRTGSNWENLKKAVDGVEEILKGVEGVDPAMFQIDIPAYESMREHADNYAKAEEQRIAAARNKLEQDRAAFEASKTLYATTVTNQAYEWVELKDKLQELNEELDAARHDIKTLESEGTSLRGDKANLKKEISEIYDKLNNSGKKINELKAQLAAVSDAYAKEQKKNSALEQERKETKKKITRNKKIAIGAAVLGAAAAIGGGAYYSTQNADLEGQVETGKQQIADLEGQVEAGQQQITGLEGKVEAGKQQLADAQDKLDDALKENADQQEIIGDQGGKIAGLEGQVEAGKQQIAGLEGQVEAGKQQIADLEGQVESGQQQIADLEEQVESGQQQIADLTGKIGAITDAATSSTPSENVVGGSEISGATVGTEKQITGEDGSTTLVRAEGDFTYDAQGSIVSSVERGTDENGNSYVATYTYENGDASTKELVRLDTTYVDEDGNVTVVSTDKDGNEISSTTTPVATVVDGEVETEDVEQIQEEEEQTGVVGGDVDDFWGAFGDDGRDLGR